MLNYYAGLDYSVRQVTAADRAKMRDQEYLVNVLNPQIVALVTDLTLSHEEVIVGLCLLRQQYTEWLGSHEEFEYPAIPTGATLFLNDRLGYEQPITIHRWEWSTTFGCWGALCTFANGWHGFTYPKHFSPAIDPATKEEIDRLGY